jgi:hypothetical protein
MTLLELSGIIVDLIYLVQTSMQHPFNYWSYKIIKIKSLSLFCMQVIEICVAVCKVHSAFMSQ